MNKELPTGFYINGIHINNILLADIQISFTEESYLQIIYWNSWKRNENVYLRTVVTAFRGKEPTGAEIGVDNKVTVDCLSYSIGYNGANDINTKSMYSTSYPW